jgi:nucleoside-diphosphate-sugar epimerase
MVIGGSSHRCGVRSAYYSCLCGGFDVEARLLAYSSRSKIVARRTETTPMPESINSDRPDLAPGAGLVLVTGASGHLGANLVVRLLAAGERVRVLLQPSCDNSAVDGLDVERAEGDFRNPESVGVAVKGCQRVYHCGAMISTIQGNREHRRQLFESNVVGTRHVLEAAQIHGVTRVVVTGSFSATGYHLDDPSAPSDESIPFYPFRRAMPYERTKVLAELECLRAVARGLDVVVATSCAILGGNDFLPSRMGKTLCDFANGRLRAYVPGGFEFVSARDIVSGHLLAMSRGRTGEKYIFSTRFATLDEIVGLFERVTGVPRPGWRLPAAVMAAFAGATSPFLSQFFPTVRQRLTPGAIRLLQMRRHANTSKAQVELGYQPTDIESAVEEAYAFFHARGAIKNPAARAPIADSSDSILSASPAI